MFKKIQPYNMLIYSMNKIQLKIYRNEIIYHLWKTLLLHSNEFITIFEEIRFTLFFSAHNINILIYLYNIYLHKITM